MLELHSPRDGLMYSLTILLCTISSMFVMVIDSVSCDSFLCFLKVLSILVLDQVLSIRPKAIVVGKCA